VKKSLLLFLPVMLLKQWATCLILLMELFECPNIKTERYNLTEEKRVCLIVFLFFFKNYSMKQF
jgi:hypothetical protein